MCESGIIKKMKKFKVTFTDEIEAKTEEDAYKILIKYLMDCTWYEDVTAFNFEEIKKKKQRT